jgi:hypothetical protein
MKRPAKAWIFLCIAEASLAFAPIRDPIRPWRMAVQSSSKQEPHLISYDDPTKLFHTDENGGYIPAGLSAEEWAMLRKKEADKHSTMNYGAWGPRFKEVKDPVASDMAWMCMPSLWTGEGALGTSEEIDDDDDDSVEDISLPITSDFLKDIQPWKHAHASSAEWASTYQRFAEQGESVQEMVQNSFTTRQKMDGLMTNDAMVSLTCDYVGHILQGIVYHGNQHKIDLTRLAIHCAPDLSDWDAMYQAEHDVLQMDLTEHPDQDGLFCGKVSRPDFLRAILRVRFPREGGEEEEEEEVDPLDEFSQTDLAEMMLCMDWYLALRRVGIVNPFAAVFAEQKDASGAN